MTEAPEGDALSLPLAPTELVACQIVPVVFVKKYRVPVDVEIGSAQAWNPEASDVAPLQARPVAAVPVMDTL
jgi:hypothetical protein